MNLVPARERRDWTQQALADASEVSRPVIANLERETGNPELQTLLRLAGALDVSVSELLTASQ